MSRDAAEDRRAMMGMITQIATRPAPAPPPADSGMSTVLPAIISSNSEIVKALVGGRQSAAPEKDPVDRVLEIFQAGAELREGMAASVAERAQSGELDLGKLADGAEKVIKVVRQAKDLADAGAGPDAAAAAAAAAAE